VFPVAQDLLYYFVDAKSVITAPELESLILGAGIDQAHISKVMEFLMYYGVIGLQTDDGDLYIYQVNYNPKMIDARAQRAGKGARYAINPAFWPALGITAAT
jgi:hypothetical protein